VCAAVGTKQVVQGGPGTIKTAAATASKGHPLAIMIDAGGAGAAIHEYVTNGINAVAAPFAKMEDQLESE
jgi:hypothetical protein